MDAGTRRTAVVTGASAGIGAATALRLAEEGFDVVLGARRLDRVEAVAKRCGGRALELDVGDAASVISFADQIDKADVLVNNAGMASGLSPVGELTDEQIQEMFQTNVFGLIRVTRALLPKLEAGGNGHVVNIGSTAGFETYPGGGGYTATKHAVRALTQTLRKELLGRPVRVTEVNPGLVETEFSLVRFAGDAERAKKPYEGLTPLVAQDVADCIAFVVTRPPHVNIDEIVVKPVAQATSMMIHRD